MYAISVKSVSIATALVIAATGGAAAQGQSGSMQASAQGPGNVNVVNVPTVTVGYMANPVLTRDADQRATTPFQIGVSAVFSGQVAAMNFAVPTGKRLLIKSVSAFANVARGLFVHGFFSTRVNGRASFHALALMPQGTFGDEDLFALSQPMEVFADPDTFVLITLIRSGTAGQGTDEGTVTISGYLVDVQ